ncbi:hypothetical protein L2E82_41521 [Cichorium intybus]|uniref:Uncharacterized protein n=1 Tax=Cichorium intybus TaxID=13427 RepID=A0ACB9ANK1_CICIN|nr:hypothetical protein L2E82_41521 [Cichorium intybus]
MLTIRPTSEAAVFMTHKYTSDTNWVFRTSVFHTPRGYVIFAADPLGHGLSNGLHGYIGYMDKAAATSLSYFVSVRGSEQYHNLHAFLFGESMLCIFNRTPTHGPT